MMTSMNRKWMVKQTLLVILAVLSLSSCVSWIAPTVKSEIIELQAGQYHLDGKHAALIFKIQHLGLSTYVGRFNKFDAELNFDPKNMSDASLNAIVYISSIDINDEDLAETLQSATWFNSEEFTQASFTSHTVTPVSDSSFNFSGDLTLKGVTKPVTFKATFHGGANNWITGKYTIGFSAIGQIKRSDFGMSNYIPIVGDKIDLEIYAEFLNDDS
ncbi:YceI family protein [Psychromonas antarctica]|jgi:polyisoprenoid-binding protein YceI|uniref:YceI family protein n=1 Tax=Psychromonas antarctica TaxID=67573 RepID=UPI001EE7F26D|nr:YceI family protein [Psychromonas antarctica]MCG6199913.1 YceI family protein [Psychromonas antarctica]